MKYKFCDTDKTLFNVVRVKKIGRSPTGGRPKVLDYYEKMFSVLVLCPT